MFAPSAHRLGSGRRVLSAFSKADAGFNDGVIAANASFYSCELYTQTTSNKYLVSCCDPETVCFRAL